MKKISKRTREQAAMICAIGASTPHAPHVVWDALGVDENGAIGLLCADAVHAARNGRMIYEYTWDAWRDIYAEAEAMLRCGWTP